MGTCSGSIMFPPLSLVPPATRERNEHLDQCRCRNQESAHSWNGFRHSHHQSRHWVSELPIRAVLGLRPLPHSEMKYVGLYLLLRLAVLLYQGDLHLDRVRRDIRLLTIGGEILLCSEPGRSSNDSCMISRDLGLLGGLRWFLAPF